MIDAAHIAKSFSSHRAVDDVSLRIERGEVVGLLGPNGAGKTTTIRMLAGLLHPDTGAVRIDSLDLRSHPRARARIGYLPESAPLYPEMTAQRYLDHRARLYAMPRDARRRAIAQAIERCRLGDAARRRIGVLSKGYRQRVGLASVLLHNPDVLILDEPSNGLDPGQIRETRSLVRELAEGRTMVVSSHILPEIERTCSRVVVIAGGKVRADGPVGSLGSDSALVVAEVAGDAEPLAAALHTRAGVASVLVEPVAGQPEWSRVTVAGSSPGWDGRELVAREAQALHITVRELMRRAPTLESVFASLTGGDGVGGSS